jgi:hypothetical protein
MRKFFLKYYSRIAQADPCMAVLLAMPMISRAARAKGPSAVCSGTRFAGRQSGGLGDGSPKRETTQIASPRLGPYTRSEVGSRLRY